MMVRDLPVRRAPNIRRPPQVCELPRRSPWANGSETGLCFDARPSRLEPMSAGGHASAFDIRDTLDEAVRRLSVNAGPIQERVRTAGMVMLDRLSPTDFASTEDRELFNQINAAFADTSSPGYADGSGAVTHQMSDATAERIASDILDLRDTAMGRAIRNARMTSHPESHRGSRR
jgi:hypothetical protein